MVLINETKYACQSCIKGHRSSSCLHHDRPLFEVAKKGRPSKQCEHCKDLRKTKAVHVKCVCASGAKKEQAEGSAMPEAGPSGSKPKHKRKDVTLGAPALPNGLKDVHDMALAAEVLNGLGSGTPTNKTRVDDLLNPCACLSGGNCTCCAPRKKPVATPLPASTLSGPVHPLPIPETLTLPTEADRPSSARSESSSGAPSRRTSVSASHAAHAHKTPLYSPYPASTFTPSGSRISIRSSVVPGSSASASTPEAVLRQGLKDLVSNYMKAKQDRVHNALVNFSISTGQPSSSAESASIGRAGSEREAEGNIEEVLMVSTCTCGDDCACPSCKEHGNPPAQGMGSGDEHHGCGDNCSSCFACSSHVAMPANLSTKAVMQTVADLLAASSAKLPPPPVSVRPYNLDPHNLSVLPPSAFLGGDESRAAFGLLQVPRLECCTGRCKCPPGECTCMSDCCGCCDKCLCDDEEEALLAGRDAAHPVSVTSSPAQPAQGSCCSAKAEVIDLGVPPAPIPAPAATPVASSCCAPVPTSVKKSCCAPAASTPSSSTAAPGPSKAAGKKACGDRSCGGKASQTTASRLRTLLPKPTVGGRPLARRSTSGSALPFGGASPSTGFVAATGKSSTGNEHIVQQPASGDPSASGNHRSSDKSLGQQLSPSFFEALLSQGPVAHQADAPSFYQVDYGQPSGDDPFGPIISDAEMDELMATLAAANGGNFDGLSWEAALGPRPDESGVPLGATYPSQNAFLPSQDVFLPSHNDADQPPTLYQTQQSTDQQPFDLRAYVDSISPVPSSAQPTGLLHIDAQPDPMLGDVDLFGGTVGLPSLAEFGLPDSASFDTSGVDWNALLADAQVPSPPLR